MRREESSAVGVRLWAQCPATSGGTVGMLASEACILSNITAAELERAALNVQLTLITNECIQPRYEYKSARQQNIVGESI